LPAGGVLVLLLGGLALYRLRGKLRKPAGETSFLESRLQPDSFFGASGGQRIDTREGGVSSTANPSSMSYSLSQLDAIGDVDPVAEADVYLAYGRDLQAEEILKEAMRSSPERLAIRSKLLEVYAKRRDVKGFELLATQMFSLTRGEGDDWTKAQELGRTIDPDNPLYQPGGKPDKLSGGATLPMEALGAPTVPHTAPAQPVAFEPAPDATLDSIDLDLDLDLDVGGDEPSQATESTQPLAPQPELPEPAGSEHLSLRPDLDTERVPVQPPPSAVMVEVPPVSEEPSTGLDFDIGDVPEKLSPVAPPAPADAGASSLLDFGDLNSELPGEPTDVSGGGPLARKLELAEEFRQIGDQEGARDLLEEVISKADGVLKAKAQSMLEKLG
jgi:pilus assembly protein FimV